MTDKKFVLGLIGSVLTLVTIVYVLTLCLPQVYYMDEEYPYWQQQKDYAAGDGDVQEVVFLGDSRTKYGVVASELGPCVYNLALGGGTPIEMYYTLKHYLQHHPVPKAVIVAFAPLHYQHMESYVGRDLYFHYLSNDEVDEVNGIIKNLDGKDLRWESIPYKWSLPNIYMNTMMKRLFKPNTDRNIKLYQQAAKDKGWMWKETEGKLCLADKKTVEKFEPLPSLTYYMDKLLALCVENNIPCYIEQLPIPGNETDVNVDMVEKEYGEYIRNWQQQYNVETCEQIPVYDITYFLDDSHLNKNGAIRYTKELKSKYSSLF